MAYAPDIDRAATPPSRLPAATGASPDKRRQILGGARQVFLSCGFDGASMGEIARSAGVSKGTLYVYFPSKEELFAALVTEECQRTAEACFDMDPGADVRAALLQVGHRYIRAMMEPAHIRTVRMVIGVAEKLPEIGRTYVQAGQEAGVRQLGDWLRLKMARGELAIDDVELAAWQFIIGCHAKLVMPMVFGDETQPGAASVERVVGHTVDAFLRAFAPRG
ncbi:TetR/AcrR family transcriptional regulator [Starkeya koreensis]|uniref:TetR/AcrR family transcriptional regulator n=1 Tax=Ancylobacter koreensis TaxID=266121 RepID=A0ABT0DIA6_9HYPH|nr:TetR/AcrR family transcriptional regulator [Ancylobacter koreensis]MCK0207021.1 TetR/AcrR family transcriptional regulator [Ancylobacter koreensis]